MIITIVNTILHLQNTDYDSSHDADILKLHTAITEISSDSINQEEFAKRSADVLNGISQNLLTDSLEKQWLYYTSGIFAPYAAVQLYSGNEELFPDEVATMVKYFSNGGFSNEILSFGVYACAHFLNSINPAACYNLVMDAFKICPDLAKILNKDYRYVGKAAEDHLTEECPFCGTKDDLTPYYCSCSLQNPKLKKGAAFPPAKLWIKCNQCNNFFTYNFPLTEVGNINGHYTTSSTETILQTRQPLNKYNHIFNRFSELTGSEEPGDYLEIGVGNGEMLAVAQEFGYRTDAVEICREDCEKISSALGVDIAWCDIVNYTSDKKYDVIVCGDVLEHVTKPMKVLEKVADMLKDNGVLWLSTPNYNSAYARMEKFTHCMWHELNHYTYVSRESLSELLKNFGLKIVHYDISNRFIGSMELFIKKQA